MAEIWIIRPDASRSLSAYPDQSWAVTFTANGRTYQSISLALQDTIYVLSYGSTEVAGYDVGTDNWFAWNSDADRKLEFAAVPTGTLLAWLQANAVRQANVNISITKNGTTITMPRTRDISVGGDEVATTTTMASGRTVKDIVGFRRTIIAKWDYVPATTITALLSMLRAGGFCTVSYYDPEDGETSGTFEVGMPTMEVFAYRGGAPIWHNVTLSMTAQGVDA